MRSFTLRSELRDELERVHVIAACDIGEAIFDRLKQQRSLVGIDSVVDRQELDFRPQRRCAYCATAASSQPLGPVAECADLCCDIMHDPRRGGVSVRKLCFDSQNQLDEVHLDGRCRGD